MKEHGGQNRRENTGIIQIEKRREYDSRSGGDLYPAASQSVAR